MQGAAIEAGSVVGIRYIVYRLSSGAYFKYSSGGKPVFLWSHVRRANDAPLAKQHPRPRGG